MIVIINYGMGNLGSLLNMMKRIGAKAIISSDVSDIRRADKLLLPGVGAFDSGMKNLKSLGLVSVLNDKVLTDKTPILGICLGMQLFTQGSQEGQEPGLGWLEAKVLRFNLEGLKVPHMGWNIVLPVKNNFLFKELENQARFYFAHSYYVACQEKTDVLAHTCYGHDFVSVLQRNNIMGTQFHPEKSHKFGMRLLKKFLEH